MEESLNYTGKPSKYSKSISCRYGLFNVKKTDFIPWTAQEDLERYDNRKVMKKDLVEMLRGDIRKQWACFSLVSWNKIVAIPYYFMLAIPIFHQSQHRKIQTKRFAE